MRAHLATALIGFMLSTVGQTNAALEPGAFGDDNPSLIYEFPVNFRIETAGRRITTLEIVSESGSAFEGGVQPALVQPPFGVFRPDKLFILNTEGFGDANLGQLIPPLDLDFVKQDLTATGSFLPSGSFTADLIVVPEPTSASIAVGMLILFGAIVSSTRRLDRPLKI